MATNRGASVFYYILTTLSPASEDQQSHNDSGTGRHEKIGEGQCGTVWALMGTKKVLKMPKANKGDQLWNDSVRHKRTEEAFQQTFVQLRKDINIPRYIQWIHPSNYAFWDENIGFLPKDTSKSHAFMSSRIFPVPLPLRAAIVDRFGPKYVKADKEAFLKREENKSCLVRVYLGRRETRSSSKEFRLRNFDLTVGEMEHLRLDTNMYATTMARTLAVLHWKAKLDANDVEFVLGSSPTAKIPPTADELEASNKEDVRCITENLDFYHRTVGMWLLDFDQCQTFARRRTAQKGILS